MMRGTSTINFEDGRYIVAEVLFNVFKQSSIDWSKLPYTCCNCLLVLFWATHDFHYCTEVRSSSYRISRADNQYSTVGLIVSPANIWLFDGMTMRQRTKFLSTLYLSITSMSTVSVRMVRKKGWYRNPLFQILVILFYCRDYVCGDRWTCRCRPCVPIFKDVKVHSDFLVVANRTLFSRDKTRRYSWTHVKKATVL